MSNPIIIYSYSIGILICFVLLKSFSVGLYMHVFGKTMHKQMSN